MQTEIAAPNTADSAIIGEFSTSDMRIVIALMVFKVPILRTSKEDRRVVFFFDSANPTLRDLLKKRQCGEPIAISDIDCVFDSLSRFHSIVHQA